MLLQEIQDQKPKVKYSSSSVRAMQRALRNGLCAFLRGLRLITGIFPRSCVCTTIRSSWRMLVSAEGINPKAIRQSMRVMNPSCVSPAARSRGGGVPGEVPVFARRDRRLPPGQKDGGQRSQQVTAVDPTRTSIGGGLRRRGRRRENR